MKCYIICGLDNIKNNIKIWSFDTKGYGHTFVDQFGNKHVHSYMVNHATIRCDKGHEWKESYGNFCDSCEKCGGVYEK